MSIQNINLEAGEEMNFLQTSNAPTTNSDSVLNPQEVYTNRLNTCMNCEYITEDRLCNQCDCPVVMMAQFNFKTCPKGYW